jgi:UDP-N-acetylmuramyl pentapeptide phosphotransferase/UDP-N-acetylglucosamine-1-phosphate transferase
VTFYALVLIVATVVSFAVSLVMWRLNPRWAVRRDIRQRDVHENPTPRLGGLALFSALLVATIVASQ